MREAKRESNSNLVISLDAKTGKKVPKEKAAPALGLLKSQSLNIKIKNGDFISSADEYAENDELMDSISVIEESNSYFSQSNAHYEDMHHYKDKSRSSKKYNRKEKSLGELCKKFIYLYGSQSY